MIKGWAKRLFSDNTKKTDDGRDQWGSRTSYVLASMGGAVGFGNLLRYPSQVFNNNGLQWFIPYLMAITLLLFLSLFSKSVLDKHIEEERSWHTTARTNGVAVLVSV